MGRTAKIRHRRRRRADRSAYRLHLRERMEHARAMADLRKREERRQPIASGTHIDVAAAVVSGEPMVVEKRTLSTLYGKLGEPQAAEKPSRKKAEPKAAAPEKPKAAATEEAKPKKRSTLKRLFGGDKKT